MRKLRGVLCFAALATALTGVGCDDSESPSNGSNGGGGGVGPTGATGGGGSSTQTTVVPITGTEVHVSPSGDAASADGTEAKPFKTVAAAMATIKGNKSWTGTLFIHEGTYELTEDVILPLGVKLNVEAGTTLKVGDLKAINAQADVKMLGTKEKPILITWLTEGKPWGAVTNYEPAAQDNVFKYVIFEHGMNANFRDLLLRGVLALHSSKALISHCIFRNNNGDDGLTLVKSDSIVEYTQFLNNASDAIDQGTGHAEIRYSYAEGNGNDAWDVGDGSTAFIHHNVAYKNGDKCISMGEGSGEVIAEHNLCVENEIGVAIKDESIPIVRFNTLYNNGVGVWVYPSAAGYGSGKGTFTNNIVWNSKQADFDLSADAATVFSYICAKTITKPLGGTVTGTGILTPGAGCDDPMFVDPDNADPNLRDFHLKSKTGRYEGLKGLNIVEKADEVPPSWVTDAASSPCIDKGDPATDSAVLALEPAPNGSAVNLGTYGGTEQASKSP